MARCGRVPKVAPEPPPCIILLRLCSVIWKCSQPLFDSKSLGSFSDFRQAQLTKLRFVDVLKT